MSFPFSRRSAFFPAACFLEAVPGFLATANPISEAAVSAHKGSVKGQRGNALVRYIFIWGTRSDHDHHDGHGNREHLGYIVHVYD